MNFARVLTEDEQKIRFHSIVNRDPEYNMVCADCGSKNPTWCSLDLGVLVCLDCSGGHRRLGPRVSRIRSMKIDSWKEQDICLFDKIGNRESNSYYEYKLLQRGGNQTTTKPNQDTDLEFKITFIRQKYLDNKFVRDSSKASPAQLFFQQSNIINPNNNSQEQKKSTKQNNFAFNESSPFHYEVDCSQNKFQDEENDKQKIWKQIMEPESYKPTSNQNKNQKSAVVIPLDKVTRGKNLTEIWDMSIFMNKGENKQTEKKRDYTAYLDSTPQNDNQPITRIDQKTNTSKRDQANSFEDAFKDFNQNKVEAENHQNFGNMNSEKSNDQPNKSTLNNLNTATQWIGFDNNNIASSATPTANVSYNRKQSKHKSLNSYNFWGNQNGSNQLGHLHNNNNNQGNPQNFLNQIQQQGKEQPQQQMQKQQQNYQQKQHQQQEQKTKQNSSSKKDENSNEYWDKEFDKFGKFISNSAPPNKNKMNNHDNSNQFMQQPQSSQQNDPHIYNTNQSSIFDQFFFVNQAVPQQNQMPYANTNNNNNQYNNTFTDQNQSQNKDSFNFNGNFYSKDRPTAYESIWQPQQTMIQPNCSQQQQNFYQYQPPQHVQQVQTVDLLDLQ